MPVSLRMLVRAGLCLSMGVVLASAYHTPWWLTPFGIVFEGRPCSSPVVFASWACQNSANRGQPCEVGHRTAFCDL